MNKKSFENPPVNVSWLHDQECISKWVQWQVCRGTEKSGLEVLGQTTGKRVCTADRWGNRERANPWEWKPRLSALLLQAARDSCAWGAGGSERRWLFLRGNNLELLFADVSMDRDPGPGWTSAQCGTLPWRAEPGACKWNFSRADQAPQHDCHLTTLPSSSTILSRK